MAEQHRATNLQWACIKAQNCDKSDVVAYSTIHELLCRIEALEAAQQHAAASPGLIDPKRDKAALEMMQAAGFAPLWGESELCAATRLHSYKVGKAEPIENWGFGHTLVDPPVYTKAPKDAKPADSPPQPNHPEIPGGSLKKRIKSRMIDTLGATWEVTAASVLVEIAAWLDTVQGFTHHTHAAVLLRREAER